MVETGRQGVKEDRSQMTEDREKPLNLLESSREGAIATIGEDGRPFASAAGFLYEKSAARFGKIYFLLSGLARHTKNLLKHPDASLLVMEETDAPVHEKKRATAQGRVRRVEASEKWEALKSNYLKVFPRAEIFFTLPDFRFYEMEISEIHWIGGFGQAKQFKS